MPSVIIEEVQARLSEIIDQLQPGEPVVITRNDQPVARLVAESQPGRQPRKAGSAKGVKRTSLRKKG